MEDKNKKHLNDNQFEDLSTLKMKKYKLILKKKELSKTIEMNRILKSDNIKTLSHWDILLMQTKFMALDFHEERKWKKGMNYVLSNQIAGKVKKNKSMKKLDELYKKCMCLYLSMNVNNNITDISLGKDNKNMNTRLNTYIKSISDLDYLRDQFDNWKNSLQMLKIKIDKKFGQKNINKAQNFLKVLNLMENMISIQEDTIKRLNEIKERAIQQSIKINQTPNFTNFLEDIDEEMRANERFRMNIDNNFYMEQTNILDLNTVGKEMNQLIEEITNEVLNYYEGTDNGMMLSSTNSATPGDLSTTSTNIMTQDQMYVEDLHCQADHDVMSGVNPKQLFYDSKNISNNPKDLRMYLEKITNSDKVDILPNYNYKKVSGAEIDVNLDEFGKVWLKVFPCIFSLDRSKDMMIDSEIEFYKMKNYRALKDQEHLRLYQHKFENMTSMQKLILFWALCQYGTYMNIICEIPNIFSISKSVNYDPEEINIFLDKALEQLGIDMYASNFENLQFGEKNNRNKAMFIYNIDPAMLNSTQCNFIYNRKILNYVHHRTDKVNRILDETENKHGISTYKPYNELNSISLVYYCPLFKPASIKKLMFKYLYEELKRFCDKFENLYNVQNTMQTYNYYTMQKNSTVKESKKATLHIGKEKFDFTANRQEILSQLNISKMDFTIKQITESVLDNTKPNIKPEILEGVSFYSFPSIQKEWEILRHPWYQNNTQFKPKFRKHNKLPNTLQPSNIQYQPNVSGGGVNPTLLRSLNDNRSS